MTTKKITTTKATINNKKRPLEKVKQPKVVEKVVVEEKPAWNDDEDEDEKEDEVVEEPIVNNNNNTDSEDENEDEDEDDDEDENNENEQDEEDEQENQQAEEKKVKKVKVEHNGQAWVDEEDTNGLKFRNRNLLSVTPEWAKVKEDKDEKDKDEENVFNSNKKLIKNEDVKFFTDKFQGVLRGQVIGVVYSSDSNVIVMADVKGCLRVYPGIVELTKKFQPLYQTKFVNFSISNIYFVSKTKEIIITGEEKEYYYTFELLTEKITKHPLRVGKNYLKKSAISEDYFAISDSTGRIMMISTISKTIVNELRMPSSEISAMSFSFDGKILFVASEGNIFCFSVESMSIVHKFKDYGNVGSNSITKITCSQDGNYFVTGSESGIVNSYRFSDCMHQKAPKPLKTLESIVYPITTLEFSPDSSMLLAASKHNKKSSKIIQYPSHKVNTYFSAPVNVASCCFSPNSQRIIIGEDFGSLIFYKLKNNINNPKLKSKKTIKKKTNNNNNTKNNKK